MGAASTVKSGDHDYGLEGYPILRYALVSGPGVGPGQGDPRTHLDPGAQAGAQLPHCT